VRYHTFCVMSISRVPARSRHRAAYGSCSSSPNLSPRNWSCGFLVSDAPGKEGSDESKANYGRQITAKLYGAELEQALLERRLA